MSIHPIINIVLVYIINEFLLPCQMSQCLIGLYMPSLSKYSFICYYIIAATKENCYKSFYFHFNLDTVVSVQPNLKSYNQF